MSPFIIGLIGILVLLVFFAARMPVAYSMGLVGFIGFSYLVSVSGGFDILVKDLFYTFASYSLSVIPAFIWMGYLAFYSGVSGKLYASAYKWVGHLRGGLAMATVAACAAFGAICGSNTATAGTMGAVTLPEMKRYNYDPQLATSTVAAGAILGILIPPSVVLIIYGIATEVSISMLFIAGILPGILLAFLYAIVIYMQVKRNPRLGPPGPRTGFKERLLSLRGGAGETLFIFAIVVGGLIVGFFTPTEAGAIGALAVLVVGLAMRYLKWEGFVRSLAQTTRTTAMIMFMVAGAIIFGRFMAVSRIPFELAAWTGALPLPPFAIMGIIFLTYFVLGMFIEALAVILLTIPIFFPVVVMLGYDPVWFGVVITMLGGLGAITPPVGINVYIVKGVAEGVSLATIFRGIWPFVGAIFACLAILVAFPSIVLFLPKLAGY